MVYNSKKQFYAVLFPPLSVGRLNNLLGFGIEIHNILRRLSKYSLDDSKVHLNKLLNHNYEISNLTYKDSVINSVFESIFVIYYGNTKSQYIFI